jgi:hypothetical protein
VQSDSVVLTDFASSTGSLPPGATLPNAAAASSPTSTLHLPAGGRFQEDSGGGHIGLVLAAHQYLEIRVPIAESPLDAITVEVIALVPSPACPAVWLPGGFGLAAFQNSHLGTAINVTDFSTTATPIVSTFEAETEDFEISGNVHHYGFTFNGLNFSAFMDNHVLGEAFTETPCMIARSDGDMMIYVGQGSGCEEERTEEMIVYFLRIDSRAKSRDELERPDPLCKSIAVPFCIDFRYPS